MLIAARRSQTHLRPMCTPTEWLLYLVEKRGRSRMAVASDAGLGDAQGVCHPAVCGGEGVLTVCRRQPPFVCPTVLHTAIVALELYI